MPSEQKSKCDIVYLAKGRPEFTALSLKALAANTNWERVDAFIVYTDGTEPTASVTKVEEQGVGNDCGYADICTTACGGPVGVMNLYLRCDPAPLWAKIDNDVIVPPGWLDACLNVMDARPELDLLGIEPPESRTPAPWAGGRRVPAPELVRVCRNYAPCASIGGIGMFRTRAWRNRPPMIPRSTYAGFGDWAQRTNCVCGWIVPPLKLFLLDRLPMEPWAGLSKRYIAQGSQRPWTNYSAAEAESLAGWWLKSADAKIAP